MLWPNCGKRGQYSGVGTNSILAHGVDSETARKTEESLIEMRKRGMRGDGGLEDDRQKWKGGTSFGLKHRGKY